MRSFDFRLLVAAGLFVTFAKSPLLAQPLNPVIREGVTEKISAHVHVIPDGSMPLVPNVGIIVGTKGVFVIDTGLGRKNGEAVVREVIKLGEPSELYLASTHFHPEHDLGAGGFPPETKLLRSEDQQKDIAEFGLELAEVFSRRSPFVADLLKGAEYRPATISFAREHTVDLGGVTVRLLAMGANHTRGDTAFFVEPDNVLFSGDVVMRPQPSFASPYSTIQHWLGSLDRLEQLKPARIVPSHGPMGGVELISGYRDYFATIRSRVAAMKQQGKSLEETTDVLAGEWESTYRDRNRLAGAIRAAYRETP